MEITFVTSYTITFVINICITFVTLKFTTMKDRLEQFLKLEQLTPARFADILGIQRSGISHILSGRNKPSFEFFERIVQKYPQINLEWLISGKGKVYKEPNAAQNSYNVDLFNVSNNIDKSNIIPVNKEIKTQQTTSEPQMTTNITPVKVNLSESKKLIRVIFVYDDKTFSEYISED